MAEILSRGDLYLACGHRSAVSLSCRKRGNPSLVGSPRSRSLPFKSLRSSSSSSLNSDFHGRRLVVEGRRAEPIKGNPHAISVQMGLCIAKALKWWEKGTQPNMKEVKSAQDLADSLLNAGNQLVVVDFFSPGCGGCKALHPKICQFAEMNPDVLFLQVNYEEHKSMCYSLNVHVLPFFRFYRGAQGRVCSFSCTNATIKKFKDALAKHTTDRCSLGTAKGLEESELVALAANKELSFKYTRKAEPTPTQDAVPEPAPPAPKLPVSSAPRATQDCKKKALATARN